MRGLALFVGSAALIAAAPASSEAAIVTYPLPSYVVSGSSYVNEDIENLAVTPSGDIWWAAFEPGNIGELVPSQASAGTTDGQRIITPDTKEVGDYPNAVAVGPDGDIYFSTSNPGGIWKIDPAVASPTPTLVTSASSARGARSIAFSPINGDMFFSTQANTVEEALAPGYGSLTGTVEVGDPFAWGVIVDPHGNAWVGEDGRGGSGRGAIGEISYASGGALHDFPVPHSPSEVQALTVDHSGDIWFADRGSNSIGELIPSQTSPGTTNGISEYKIPVPSGGSEAEEPYGITTAADGSIWFTESDSSYSHTANNQIGEVTPVSGQSTVVFSMTGTPDGKQPQAIVADGSGNVWYAAGGGNSADELGEVVGGAPGGTTKTTEPTGGEKSGTTEATTSPTTSSAVVETVTTSAGQSITLATAPGQAGYAALDQHLLGGLSGNDIAKLLANGGFSIQIPLSYPAYPGNYSASGSASPSGIPGYDGEGVDGGEFTGSGGGESLAFPARSKAHRVRSVVLFRYQHNYTKAGTYKAKVRFTAAGRKLLQAAERAHRKLKVSISLSLTAKGHPPIRHSLSTTLKPGSGKSKKR